MDTRCNILTCTIVLCPHVQTKTLVPLVYIPWVAQYICMLNDILYNPKATFEYVRYVHL